MLCCCSNYNLILKQNCGSTKWAQYLRREETPLAHSNNILSFPYLNKNMSSPFSKRIGQPGQLNYDFDIIIVSLFSFNHVVHTTSINIKKQNAKHTTPRDAGSKHYQTILSNTSSYLPYFCKSKYYFSIPSP